MSETENSTWGEKAAFVLLGILLAAAVVVSSVLVINYCKYADTAVLEIVGLVLDIIALAVAVFSNLKSRPKIIILAIMLVVTVLVDWFYLYPRTCPPQIYRRDIEQIQGDSDSSGYSYIITVEANRTVNTIIIYEDETRISEISDYKRAEDRRIFSDVVTLDHSLARRSLTVEIRLPSGELLEVHAAKNFYPASHNTKLLDIHKPVKEKRMSLSRPSAGNVIVLGTPAPADTYLPLPPDIPGYTQEPSVPRQTPKQTASARPRATPKPSPVPTPAPTPPPAPSLSFTPGSFSANLEPGQNIPLSCTVKPDSTEISSIRWSSSNSTAAYVDSTDGLETVVHILGSGQAVISVKITTPHGDYSNSLTLVIP